jgi:hypothetical protein
VNARQRPPGEGTRTPPACYRPVNPGGRWCVGKVTWFQVFRTMRTATRIRAGRIRRRPSNALPINVRPTGPDVAIARAVDRDTEPAPEEIARTLTWGADEKVLLVLAAVGWLASRGRGESLQRAGNHALLVSVAASLLPHVLKTVFNQIRPDRMTVRGHLHGVSFSGKPEDAFPSGHAVHMGALASAAGTLPPGDPGTRGWPVADTYSGPGTLGERRRRRIRAWSGPGEAPATVDRLSARSFKGGRSCRSLKA